MTDQQLEELVSALDLIRRRPKDCYEHRRWIGKAWEALKARPEVAARVAALEEAASVCDRRSAASETGTLSATWATADSLASEIRALKNLAPQAPAKSGDLGKPVPMPERSGPADAGCPASEQKGRR